MQRLVVVPHTHWDREWYRTHEEFRYRLVGLMDRLLDLLEGDPAFRRFTLDGQTIVVDDYLEVRPEARDRIAKLVSEGRLLVGPWYVLPDEWLVSGEALIRNLRLGLARAAALGGALAVGYVPDQFGHVGQLPQIFAGFGMREAVLWRGVGEDVDGTLFRWQGPDGTVLLAVHLLRGYGHAAHLPLETSALAARLRELAEDLAAHSPVPSLLLMNGSDHLEPQPGLPAALEAAAARLGDAEVELAGLSDYLARVREEAPEQLPLHRGELRSGLRAPLLEGCASARTPQKRANFRGERLLLRYLEPLCAWLGELGGDPDPGVLAHAWRLALQNHPHDSICGCSVDAVHAQMDQRFAQLEQLGTSHLRRVVADLGGRVALPAMAGGAGAGVMVWNPHAPGRVAFEGVVEVDVRGRRPALHLRGADGRRVPVSSELQRPAELFADYELPGRVAALLLRGFPAEFMGLVPRGLALRRRGGSLAAELLLGEDADAFDFASAREAVAARLEQRGEEPVQYRVRRLARVRLRGVDALPGFGLAVYRLARGRAGGETAVSGASRSDGSVEIRNAAWRVVAAADGRVRCEHLPSGEILEDALCLASEGDRGDEYNFDPVPGAESVTRPERARVVLLPVAQGEAALRIDAVYRVPVALAAGRGARASRRVALPARIRLRLLEGLDRVDVEIELENTARDHRLRALLRAPFAATRFEVESAFEVAERPIAPQSDAFGSGRPAEWPIGATPQRSFATLVSGERAFSVANRGLAEVEALPEAGGRSTRLAVTLLRAVGWLSRGDLGLRPGLAGPPLETPGAQVPGPHRVELCFRLHAAADPRRAVEAHAFAAPALLCAAGGGPGPLGDGARLLELDDPRVLVSALEPTREGPAQLRLLNACAEPLRPRLRWLAREGARLEPVDLRGRPDARLTCEREADGALRLSLRPWQIVSLRVR